MPGCTEQALAWVFSKSPPKSPPCGDAAALKPLNNRAAVTVATGCLLNPAHCLIPVLVGSRDDGTTVRLRLQGPSAAFDSICRARLEDNKSLSPSHSSSFAPEDAVPVAQQLPGRQLGKAF